MKKSQRKTGLFLLILFLSAMYSAPVLLNLNTTLRY